MKRRLVLPLITIALAALPGCNRGPKQELNDNSSLDHISKAPHLPPQRVTHGSFTLGKYQKFSFEVPAHVIMPHLQGEFSSFTQGADGAKVSDESADVELMVMTEEQFDALVYRRSAESLYAIEPSHNHGVSISLPSTQDSPVRYYAVFRRNTEGKAPISVNANLTLELGSST